MKNHTLFPEEAFAEDVLLKVTLIDSNIRLNIGFSELLSDNFQFKGDFL